MPKYDNTLVVTPEYWLLMQARVELNYEPAMARPIENDRAEVPVRIGEIDLTGYGYPLERYGFMTITDIAEDFSSITLLFDGETLTLPPNRLVTLRWEHEVTEPEYLPEPPAVSKRSLHIFGEFRQTGPTPTETVVFRLCVYRKFEDLFKEAYYYLRRVEAGDVAAQLIIAEMLYDGTGLHQSRKEARE